MISVIMPVYNSQKYLAAAIESVLRQSYVDFELILVDDGSTDTSGKLCDMYAARDHRVVVVHQKNGGICAARNTGLGVAKGEYISFIDNDDLFEEHLLEDNIQLAVQNDADIVCFGVGNFEDETSMESFSADEKKISVFDRKYIREHYFQLRTENFSNIWNKLFKRKVIERHFITFHESFRFGYEDYMFNVENLFKADKIVINSKRYYIHFARMGHSTSLKYNFNRVESLIQGANIELPLCDFNNVGQNDVAGVCAFYVKIIARELYGKDKNLSSKQKRNVLESLCFDTSKYGKEVCQNYIYQNDKIASILWRLYCKQHYFLLKQAVLLWKIRCKWGHRYF